MYKITFFIKEEPDKLFSLLQPLHFTRDRNKRLIWNNGKNLFTIEPFSSPGREVQGYRVYYKGTAESCQYLFERFLGYFSLSISGIEFVLETGEAQSTLISRAEKSAFIRGSMYGLYTHNGIGVCIFPNGTINFQIRNRKMLLTNLAKVAKEIDDVVSKFRPQEINLFSFMSEEEVYAS